MENFIQFQKPRRQTLLEGELRDRFQDFAVGLVAIREGIRIKSPSLFG